MSVWLASALGEIAAFGASDPRGAAPVGDRAGALAECVEGRICAQTVGAKAADALREAAVAAEGLGIGLSPAVVRGSGLALELSAQSLAFPGPFAPNGVDIPPAVPRVALGGFSGRRLRFGGGVQGGLAPPLDGIDMGLAFGGRGGIALGSPEERRWTGLELDVGYAVVQGELFDDPKSAAEALAERTVPVKTCPRPCIDVLTLVNVGLDSVFTFDVDQNTALFGRLGGVFQSQTIDVGADGSRWRWSGLLPRATLGAGYRPQSHALVAAAVRLGMLEENLQPGPGLLWLASLSIGWRFGPELVPPDPLPPAPVVQTPVPDKPPPIVVPKIPVVEHPELDCGPDRIATGAPPPLGLEAWCVVISPYGAVLADGPYLRWHDADHIAERGENRMGQPSGTWTRQDPNGALISFGMYQDGLKEGVWRTYYPSGQLEKLETYHRGLLSGHFESWSEDATGVTQGEYWNGVRTGSWEDFKNAQLVRRREYRDGNLMSDEYVQLPQ